MITSLRSDKMQMGRLQSGVVDVGPPLVARMKRQDDVIRCTLVCEVLNSTVPSLPFLLLQLRTLSHLPVVKCRARVCTPL